MVKRSAKEEGFRSRRGAALLIVLGLLAVLSALALAFALRLRSARLSGRAVLAEERADELLGVALARAEAEIDRRMGSAVYPPFSAFGSSGAPGASSKPEASLDVAIGRGELPGAGSALRAAFDAAASSARRQTVRSRDGRPLGDVGFVVLDLSGLIDANFVPGEALRPEFVSELSHRPAVRFSPDGFSASTNSGTAFAENRDNAWRRFDSLRELYRLNLRGAPNVFSRSPRSFRTFSHCPEEELGTRTLLEPGLKAARFVATLRKCGLSEREARIVWAQYLDYVDADDVPGDPTLPCAEAVPMVDEIGIENGAVSVRGAGSNATLTVSGTLFVETWFPFEGRRPPRPGFRFFFDGAEGRVGLLPEGEAASNAVSATVTFSGAKSNGAFRVDRFAFSGRCRLEPTGSAILPSDVELRIDRIDETCSGVAIDRVESIRLVLSLSGVAPTISRSCADPRVNADFADSRCWTEAGNPTPGGVNDLPSAYWGEEAGLADKGRLRLFVRNGPMRHPVELGRLSLGEPWRTLCLYGGDRPLQTVLDRFATRASLAASRRAWANVNTPFSNMLATVFCGIPIRKLPGATAAARTTPATARRLAENLLSRRRAPVRSVAYAGNALAGDFPEKGKWSDVEKEAVVAGCVDRLLWRDALFAVVATARSGEDFDGDGRIGSGEVSATRRAVWYLWRDPVGGRFACSFFGDVETLRSPRSGEAWAGLLKGFDPN